MQRVCHSLSIADSRRFPQPQNEYIELHQKRHGYRLDHFERGCAASPDQSLSGPTRVSIYDERHLRRPHSL